MRASGAPAASAASVERYSASTWYCGAMPVTGRSLSLTVSGVRVRAAGEPGKGEKQTAGKGEALAILEREMCRQVWRAKELQSKRLEITELARRPPVSSSCIAGDDTHLELRDRQIRVETALATRIGRYDKHADDGHRWVCCDVVCGMGEGRG